MKKFSDYPALLVVLLIVLLIFPIVIKNNFYINILIFTFLYAALSGAWNFIGGYAGQLSLGHTAFFGIGAYTSTLLFLHAGISPWLGMIIGGIIASLVATAISYPCFRLKGPFFSLATLAFAEVIRLLSIYLRDLTAGSSGLLIPFSRDPASFIFQGKMPYYYISLLLMLLILLITKLISNSKFGFYLVALREDEDAASVLGVKATRYKLWAMILSSFLTAVLGTFYAQYVLYIDPPGVFNMNLSIQIALIAIVGGAGTVWGPFVGSALLTPLNELLRGWFGGSFQGLNFIIYGCLLFGILIIMPEGIYGRFESWRKSRSLKINKREVLNTKKA